MVHDTWLPQTAGIHGWFDQPIMVVTIIVSIRIVVVIL